MGTVRHAAWPLAPASRLNRPLARGRHLAWTSRPLRELQDVKDHFDTRINDVVLTVSAGALRSLMLASDEDPIDLKAMVPVSVRTPGDEWGNRLAFLFPTLPCTQPDPVRRLRGVQAEMAARKQADEPQGADAILSAVAQTPKPVRNLGARALTSDRLFNLIVSHIPGPPIPLFLMGCRATRAYPIVPLDDGHGVSIGMTSVDGQACFGRIRPKQACRRRRPHRPRDPPRDQRTARGHTATSDALTHTTGCAATTRTCSGGERSAAWTSSSLTSSLRRRHEKALAATPRASRIVPHSDSCPSTRRSSHRDLRS